MRLNEILTEAELEILDELTRRGFLKGLGAAAATAAVPSLAKAAPFKHGEYKDQMSGEKQGKFAKVKADNGNATLEIEYDSGQPKVIIDIPRTVINYRRQMSDVRIKIGNSPVESTYLNQGTANDYSWGAILDKDLANRILSHSGELKFEVNFYKDGPKVFVFTIEQDTVTKKFSQDNKSQIGKDREEKTKSNRANEISMKKMSVESYIKERLRDLKGFDFPEGLEVKFTIDKKNNISNFTHKFRGFRNEEHLPKYANKEFFEKILPNKLPDVFFNGNTAELEIDIMKTNLVIVTVRT